MYKTIINLSLLAIFLLVSLSSFQKQETVCYVPDEKTAIKIALAVWHPIYGDKLINKYKPYHAELKKDSVWSIWGSLPRGTYGGTPEMLIQKSDGKILQVILGK